MLFSWFKCEPSMVSWLLVSGAIFCLFLVGVPIKRLLVELYFDDVASVAGHGDADESVGVLVHVLVV